MSDSIHGAEIENCIPGRELALVNRMKLSTMCTPAKYLEVVSRTIWVAIQMHASASLPEDSK